MPKKMRSTLTGVEFDYVQTKIDMYPDLFETVIEVPKKRGRSKNVGDLDGMDSRRRADTSTGDNSG